MSINSFFWMYSIPGAVWLSFALTLSLCWPLPPFPCALLEENVCFPVPIISVWFIFLLFSFHRWSRRHFHLASSLRVIHSAAVFHFARTHCHIRHPRSNFVVWVFDTVSRTLRIAITVHDYYQTAHRRIIGAHDRVYMAIDRMPFAGRPRPKGFNTINEQFSFNAEYYTHTHTRARSDAIGEERREEEHIHAILFKFMLQTTTDSVYGLSHFFLSPGCRRSLCFFIIIFCCCCRTIHDPMPRHRPPRHLAMNVMRQP